MFQLIFAYIVQCITLMNNISCSSEYNEVYTGSYMSFHVDSHKKIKKQNPERVLYMEQIRIKIHLADDARHNSCILDEFKIYLCGVYNVNDDCTDYSWYKIKIHDFGTNILINKNREFLTYDIVVYMAPGMFLEINHRKRGRLSYSTYLRVFSENDYKHKLVKINHGNVEDILSSLKGNLASKELINMCADETIRAQFFHIKYNENNLDNILIGVFIFSFFSIIYGIIYCCYDNTQRTITHFKKSQKYNNK